MIIPPSESQIKLSSQGDCMVMRDVYILPGKGHSDLLQGWPSRNRVLV